MDKEIQKLFDELAIVNTRVRKRNAENRKDKKKAEALLAQVEAIAKKKKNKVVTKKHAITFKYWTGGDYHVPRYSTYGVDQIIPL